MVEPKPPKTTRGKAAGKKATYRLVHDGRFPDSTGTKDDLEAPQSVREETLPEELGQGPLGLHCERRWNFSVEMPGILLL